MQRKSRSKSRKPVTKSQSKSKPKKALPKKKAAPKRKKSVSESSQASESISEQQSKNISPVSRGRSKNVKQKTHLKGQFIAYVDIEDNFEDFKIGQLLDDVDEPESDTEQEIFVEVFEQINPLIFKKADVKQNLFDYWIISDLGALSEEKSGKGKKDTVVKISKQQETRVKKLMPQIVTQIQEHENAKKDEEESSEDEDSDESSSESSESESEDQSQSQSQSQSEQMKIDSVADIKKRKMFKVKPSPQKRSRKSKSPPKKEKKGSARMGTRSKSKVQGTKQQQDSEAESEEEKEEVKQSKKRESKKQGNAAAAVVQSPGKKSGSLQKKETIKRQQSAKKQDVEMKESSQNEESEIVDHNEEEEEDESIEQINTSVRKGKNKKKTAKKSLSIPKVGQKRARGSSKKKAKAGSDDDEEEEDENEGDDEESPQPASKKRKGADGKEQKVKKEKKVKQPKEKKVRAKKEKQVKRPTEFKMGKWNPNIELVDIDKYKEHQTAKPFFDCCIRCNNKNVTRAANTGSIPLLEECMRQKKKISLLTTFWSPEMKWTPLDIIVGTNNHDMMEAFLHPDLAVPLHTTYEQQRNQYYNDRTYNPQYLMNLVDTGKVSDMAYGTRIRKVQVSRGNRQGNNAFLQFEDNHERNPHSWATNQTFVKRMTFFGGMTIETYRMLIKLNPNVDSFFSSYAYDAVRAGNIDLAYEIISKLIRYPNYGFNNLHADVLNPEDHKEYRKQLLLKEEEEKKNNEGQDKEMKPLDVKVPKGRSASRGRGKQSGRGKKRGGVQQDSAAEEDEEESKKMEEELAKQDDKPDGILMKFMKTSVTKKAGTNKDINPMHCACINPNENVLRELLGINPEAIAVPDQDLRRPIHYAAACKGPGPLALLIEKGANVGEIDNQKTTALHFAAMTNRVDNIAILLQHCPKLLNQKDKKGMTPLAYACKYMHLDFVKALIPHKPKVNLTAGIDRMTPLIFAAAVGHYDIAEFLLDNKARVLNKDKFKRDALTLAVRNGHTKIASLLLQRGADWNWHDSSMNTPLHYASAYGWLDCIDLLLKAGADVNAENSWRLTPINIAMLKNHQGCVKKLLEEPNVDVNGKDDKGRTLLLLSLLCLDEESPEFIKYLLKKGANCNIQDLEGNAALHYIAKFKPSCYQYNSYHAEYRVEIDKQTEIQKQITQLLIQNNSDKAMMNTLGETPFSLCLKCNNKAILEYLLDNVSLNNDQNLIFQFTDKILQMDYHKILSQLMRNDRPTAETINFLDSQGFTPILRFIEAFTRNYPGLLGQIQQRINGHSYDYVDHLQRIQYDRIKAAITNASLFETYPNQTNWNKYNYAIDANEKVRISREIGENIVVRPFIEFLKLLQTYGADPTIQVQKLFKYRDEEEKQKLKFANLQENQSKGKKLVEEEEKIKKRDDILKEKRQKVRKQVNKRRAQQSGRNVGFGFGGIIAQQPQVDQSVFDNISGKAVEREYGAMGLRNAFHMLLAYPEPLLIEYLRKEKVDPDLADYDQVTPFNLMSRQENNHRGGDEFFEAFREELIKLDARIDYPDKNGRTPFLNYYELNHAEGMRLAYRMLDLGANVNQIDLSGMFALKCALLRRQKNEIENLIKRGANINQIDNKGRNLLHHAVNMSSATADATFETEQFLIDRGIELNLRDQRGRTPLHYAFVKIKDWKSKQQIDPIETVSSLCGCKGLETDVPDQWLKTPLHYASQRGASVSAVYLINRSAKIEQKDIYGNTPLGVGLMSGHYNYGIILIEKAVNVKAMIYREDYDKINKMFKELDDDLKKKKKMEIDESLSEEQNESKSNNRKRHKKLFNPQANIYNQYGDEYDEEDEYGQENDSDDDYDSQDEHQENVFNQQNVFNQPVYAKKAAVKSIGSVFNNYNNPYGSMFNQAQQLQNDLQNQLVKQTDLDSGVSMFKVAIRGGQQGLAYLILDKGYDLMLAMQDAMDEKKFLLVLTLLSKNPNDEIVQQSNNKGQNLFHILSQNAGGCSIEHLKRIYQTLMKRGVNCKAVDSFERTALHYAVISQSRELVHMLLYEDQAYNPNQIDVYGHSPLSLLMKGQYITESRFYLERNTFGVEVYNNEILRDLLFKGADVNHIYPEEIYKPAFKEEDVDDENYDSKGTYKCTILINCVRRNINFKDGMKDNIMCLMKHGVKFDRLDSDGRDAMTYAVIADNFSLVRMLTENKDGGKLLLKQKDKLGKTPVHYVVMPIRFGSYENVEILRLLHKAEYDLNAKDDQSRTPLSYAQEQESGILLNELITLLGLNKEKLMQIQRVQSIIPTQNWPESKVDFEQDSEVFMEKLKKQSEEEFKEKKNRVPVDSTGNFPIAYRVYCEPGNLKPWDAYLTKVDLKNGIYGDYVFYKMQLLYDDNRELYVVFTRYGRIGEDGMNQRTPFVNVEEAKEDFRKIFKQKTGGNDFDNLDQFHRQKKKYNLARVNYITIDYKDYLAPFDYEKVPKSRLSQPVFDLFEEIANVTMYQRAMSNFGLDMNALPFSALSKQVLLDARELLTKISDVVSEDLEISKEGIKADFDKLQQIKEKICELSSRYYEMIPLNQYKNQIAPPLNRKDMISKQYDNLINLTNIEFASKILLGALCKQQEQNPVDYVFDALNLMIEPLDKEGPEFEVINQYINNTRTDQRLFISNIFKVQRKGEAEQISAFKEVPNHFLLYHGSQLFNFIGILSQGLRIAPPEAPPTGYMFGKGVYFADMFDKSASYAQRGYNQQDSYLMLMCEVALGNMKQLYNSEYIEKLEPQYQSVKGCGRQGPGYKHTITLPNSVKIPYGKVIDYYKNEQDREVLRKIALAHNEYIVYNTSQVRMRYLIQISKDDPNKKKQK